MTEQARETPEPLTPEEAVEKALLYTFQLSDKDYRKMQRASSETAFIRALEQDGYTIAALRAATPDPAEPVYVEGLARRHYEPQRHFFESPDGNDVCSTCGEFRDADFVRVTIHYNDGDG
jgi:hypothetical protein